MSVWLSITVQQRANLMGLITVLIMVLCFGLIILPVFAKYHSRPIIELLLFFVLQSCTQLMMFCDVL